MPSLRHSSATLSSPRKPAITMRTFSSAEYNRRVARLISRTAFSASSECVSAFDLISAPFALKMSQKPSLPQSLQTVQLVLTGNSYGTPVTIPLLTAGSRWCLYVPTVDETVLNEDVSFRAGRRKFQH